MTEYLRKSAMLEWLGLMHLEYSHNTAVSEFIESGIEIFESGAFDADESEGTWKATAEVLGRENAQMNTEIQRLRAAAIKLHETINSFWQGDCDKADVVAAQSKLCDVLSTSTGAERAQREAERLREERDKLIEGLRWYADEENQKLDESTRYWENVYSPYEMDGGQRARDILKEIGVTVEWQKSANDMRTTR